MNTENKWIRSFRRWFGLLTPAEDADSREARFFFLLVTVVLAGLAITEVRGIPELRVATRLVPFALLMATHIILYWFSPRFADTLRRTLVYLMVQTALVFVLTLFPRDFSIVVGLYSSLLGISVGMVREKRRVVLSVVVWLVLVTFNLVLMLGYSALATWVIFAPPLTFFILVYVVLYGRQVAARDHAQSLLRELESAHRELAEYATQVEDLTLAAERQRMARELHDTLAQGVAGLILQLEAADAHLGAGRAERAQEIVQQAMARARSTLAEARQAIGDLRAQSSASLDLATALREEAERFTNATGIPCDSYVHLSGLIPDDLREYIVRIVAEGLVNVARHAQAAHVWISGGVADDDWIEITLRDDGIGFDPTVQAASSGHYGLIGMRERARLAGGRLTIDSVPGSGTHLRLRLPLHTKQEEDDV